MANIKKKQEEAMASIDTAKAMVDKVLSIMNIVLINPSLSLTYAANPTKFLLQILRHLGTTTDTIINWLAYVLQFIVPVLDISVKTIILTNLKRMISCSVDPRIPEQYRKQHTAQSVDNYENDNYLTSEKHGIDINLETIDFMDKLSVSPLSDSGKHMYFGLNGIEDSYKFTRAEDMDAFLWFVVHKGILPNPTKISTVTDISGSILPHGASLLSEIEAIFTESNPSSILLGNTFIYNDEAQGKGRHVVSMCVDTKYNNEGKIIKNTIIPVSDDVSSLNWYSKKYKNNDKEQKKVRDYSKEKGICNIQYINQTSNYAPITGVTQKKFKFTILPKPYIHVPILSAGEPPWRFKKMLFDDKGNYSPNGKYTFAEIKSETISQDKIVFTTNNGAIVEMDIKTSEVNATPENKSKLVKDLVECYPGLTVYEFNYDYIMSLTLFDAKTLLESLLANIGNIRGNVGFNGNINFLNEEGTETIKEIIKNIIESDGSEINNCYYTFDNSKYSDLLNRAERKRARQEKFGNVTHEIGSFESVKEILDEYDATTEYHEQEEIIKRAIKEASVKVSEGFDDTDRHAIEYDFVCNLVENLTFSIVNGVLSPKVLMLLEVNQKMMGGTWEKFTTQDLLRAMSAMIVSIVSEVSGLIIQELLKFTLKQLEPIVEMIAAILLREQLDNYSEAIAELINNCSFSWFSFENKDQETKLDNVDYADIDTSSTNKNEKPITNKC